MTKVTKLQVKLPTECEKYICKYLINFTKEFFDTFQLSSRQGGGKYQLRFFGTVVSINAIHHLIKKSNEKEK